MDLTYKMLDGRKLADIKLLWLIPWIEKKDLKKIQDTVIEELLQGYLLRKQQKSLLFPAFPNESIIF